MYFPKYWAKGAADGVTQRHPQTAEPIPLACWGWSDVSLEEAAERGRERAQGVAERLRRGEPLKRYPYGRSPFREQVLDSWTGNDGAACAVVSRNSYGSRVLNTLRVMFVDVDLPEPRALDGLKRWVGGLFGAPEPPAPQDATLARAEAVVRADPESGLRVYRTRGGLRLLITHAHADPAADATRRLMEHFDADPLYLRLCRSAKCFRARLTPKPWRCGHRALDVTYPWADADARARADRWLERYERASAGHATCELIAELGRPASDPEIVRVVELHDRETKVGSGLPLA